MDSPTGKRVLTSSQDNLIMQARVPESVIWQWGLSPWKQVSTEWLALCLAKNGNPLLGRGTWAWHSKFLSFLSFGSWLMPSVHYQKKKKKKASVWPANLVKVPAFVVQLREGAGSSRDTDSRQISETTMWGRILRQRAGTRFWKVHQYLPFPDETNAIQSERWDCQIINNFMYFSCQCHRKTGDLGRLFCLFFKKKKKRWKKTARNKCFLNTSSNLWKE